MTRDWSSIGAASRIAWAACCARRRGGRRGDAIPPGSGRQQALVPAASIAGKALVTVIAIMTFLAASLPAARSWSPRRRRLALVGGAGGHHPGPTDGGRDVGAGVARAADLARRTPGVHGRAGLHRAESERLLEPWLGTGLNSTSCRCRASRAADRRRATAGFRRPAPQPRRDRCPGRRSRPPAVGRPARHHGQHAGVLVSAS